MRLRLRSYVLFLIALLSATYGAGQLWNLATGLRSGAAGAADVVTGILGAIILAAAATVLGRILYVISNSARSVQMRPEGQKND